MLSINTIVCQLRIHSLLSVANICVCVCVCVCVYARAREKIWFSVTAKILHDNVRPVFIDSLGTINFSLPQTNRKSYMHHILDKWTFHLSYACVYQGYLWGNRKQQCIEESLLLVTYEWHRHTIFFTPRTGIPVHAIKIEFTWNLFLYLTLHKYAYLRFRNGLPCRDKYWSVPLVTSRTPYGISFKPISDNAMPWIEDS